MNKIEFKDFPNLSTPINSENLNQMQTNIENAVEENKTSIGNIENNITTMESDISTINSDITKIETDANALKSRVTTIENFKGIAAYGDGYIDAATTTEHLLLTQIGTPNQSLYFVITLFFGYRTATANRTQVAIPYNFDTASMKNTVYIRYFINGAWTTWRLINS